MKPQTFHSELTYRGLMILRILGNASPSLHQIEFIQNIVSLIGENDPLKNKKLESIFTKYSIQSRESLQKDSQNLRNISFVE